MNKAFPPKRTATGPWANWFTPSWPKPARTGGTRLPLGQPPWRREPRRRFPPREPLWPPAARRQEPQTEGCKQRMKHHHAIEGTPSELIRGHGLRQARFRSLRKVKRQSYLIGAACLVQRWLGRKIWKLQQSVSANIMVPSANSYPAEGSALQSGRRFGSPEEKWIVGACFSGSIRLPSYYLLWRLSPGSDFRSSQISNIPADILLAFHHII